MIEINNICFRYSEQAVLNNLSAQFAAPGVYGIVGLNGAGKTTFFNVLSGMLKPQSGTISYGQQAINTKHTGYVETANFFYPYLTGKEYLDIFPCTNTRFQLEQLQTFMHLPLNDLIENYSTGMKKKLALLAILKQEKNIYILDEPFNGLDLETNKVLELIIQALRKKGKIVFVSSHILQPLLSVCDEIRLLEKGVFSEVFQPEDYAGMEDKLFSSLLKQAGAIIDDSI